MPVYITAICAILLAIVPLIAGKARFIDVIPRSRWLSMAGGVAVAYVFIRVMPELSLHQQTVAGLGYEWTLLATHSVYVIALLGLIVFYGLERTAVTSQAHRQAMPQEEGAAPQVFILHLVFFGLYDAIIGYLLVHREMPGLRSLLLFTLAIGLNGFTNDYALQRDFKGRYDRYGRWILAVSVLLGWEIGIMTTLHPLVIPILFAFLAGGVMLNVLKEELPAERHSSFWAFVAGAAGYTLILLLR